MSKDLMELKSQLPQQMNQAQLTFISKRTPQVFVKTRPGRGGKTFPYVEVGYVMEMLNSLFGYGSWDWEYNLEPYLSYPNTKQMVITGKLTIRIHDPETGEIKGTIIKTASGGGEVKFMQNTENPVDLADDLKSASADALKKAASMIGIAADIYYPNVYTAKEGVKNRQKKPAPAIVDNDSVDAEVQAEVEEVEAKGSAQERASLLRSIFASAQNLALKGKLPLLGKSDEEKKLVIKNWLAQRGIAIESFANATKAELEAALNQLHGGAQ